MSTTAGRRPMRADARRNHERLVTAARAAFVEHGPDASLEDIARRAGVGIGTLYRHFPTRQALQEAVYRGEVNAIATKAYELCDALPPGDALSAWMRAFAGHIAGKRALMHTLKSVLDLDSELFAQCHDEIRRAADAVLTAAREAGTARADITPTDLLRLVSALSLATEHAPDDTERLLSFLLDGIRPQG